MTQSKHSLTRHYEAFLEKHADEIPPRIVKNEMSDAEVSDIMQSRASLSYQFADEYISEKFDKIMIETNGHLEGKPSTYVIDDTKRSLESGLKRHFMILSGLRDIRSDAEFGNFVIDYTLTQCTTCDQSLFLYLDFDEEIIHFVTSKDISDIYDGMHGSELPTPSSCPASNHELVLQKNIINVPSGKLVIGDDLRHFVMGKNQPDRDAILEFYRTKSKFKGLAEASEKKRSLTRAPSINSDLGTYIFEEFYASLNVGAALIGNSSPSIFYNKSENYIAFRDDFDEIEVDCECCYDYDYDEDEDFECECGAEEPYEHDLDQYPDSFDIAKEERIGEVITDLWCVMAMDYDLLAKAMEKNGYDIDKELKDRFLNIAHVEAGDYEFTNYMGLDIRDAYDTRIYATMKKV